MKTPGDIWADLCKLDPDLAPWEELTQDERRRWRAYVNSGNYERSQHNEVAAQHLHDAS